MPRKITNQNLPNNLVSKKETQIGLYRKQLGIVYLVIERI
jgi:hypothetical protein